MIGQSSLLKIFMLMLAGWVAFTCPANAYSPSEKVALLTLMENAKNNIKKLSEMLPIQQNEDPFTAYKAYLDARLGAENEFVQKSVKELLATRVFKEASDGDFDGGFGRYNNSYSIGLVYPKNFYFSWTYFFILCHELEHAIQTFQALPEIKIEDSLFTDEHTPNPSAFFREANSMFAEHRFLQFASPKALQSEIDHLKTTRFISIDQKKDFIQSFRKHSFTGEQYVENEWAMGRYSLENLNIYEDQPSFEIIMNSHYCNILLEGF